MKTISAQFTMVFDNGLRRKERVPSVWGAVQTRMKTEMGTEQQEIKLKDCT